MKWAIYIGAGIGGIIGGYVPVMFWGADALDISSLLGGFVGTIVGLWAGYKIGKMLDF
jgi:hypothetical protein